jgi:hypothetical protein
MAAWAQVGGHEFVESMTDPVAGTGYYTASPEISAGTDVVQPG